MEKQYYFLKLNPPRPTFAMDMNPEEREIMNQHVAYWSRPLNEGKVVVYGPVMDPTCPYGIGIMEGSEQEVRDFATNDPAELTKLCKYEIFPMRAVLPPK